MELLRTSVVGLSLGELWRSLLVCGSLFIVSCSLAEECDDILRQGELSAIQAFFPSKIHFHRECSDLRQNATGTCSGACNTAIEDFLHNNGDEEAKIFFSCVCTYESDIYPLHECDIDRERLRVCPALFFLLETTTTSTTASTTTSTKTVTLDLIPKISSTETAPPTKSLIPPGKDCREARVDCQGVLSCSKAFDYVKDKCLDDFNRNGKCSKYCSQAVGYIDMYRSSRYLWKCACDPDSEEFTWCGMYGEDGLRKTCVKYELDDMITNENTEQSPKGTGIQPMVNVMIIVIPLVLLLRVI